MIAIILILHYHEWTIRQYRGGMWDAASDTSPAITVGYNSFDEVMDEVLARLGRQIRRGLGGWRYCAVCGGPDADGNGCEFCPAVTVNGS